MVKTNILPLNCYTVHTGRLHFNNHKQVRFNRNDIERRHKYVSLVQIYLTFVHVLKLPNKSV